MGSAEGIRDWEQACGGEGEGGVIDASGYTGGYAVSSVKEKQRQGERGQQLERAGVTKSVCQALLSNFLVLHMGLIVVGC